MLADVKQIIYVYERGKGWVPFIERVPQPRVIPVWTTSDTSSNTYWNFFWPQR